MPSLYHGQTKNLLFSPIQLHSESCQKNNAREGHAHPGNSRLPNTELVPSITSDPRSTATSAITQRQPANLTVTPDSQTPFSRKTEYYNPPRSSCMVVWKWWQ